MKHHSKEIETNSYDLNWLFGVKMNSKLDGVISSMEVKIYDLQQRFRDKDFSESLGRISLIRKYQLWSLQNRERLMKMDKQSFRLLKENFSLHGQVSKLKKRNKMLEEKNRVLEEQIKEVKLQAIEFIEAKG